VLYVLVDLGLGVLAGVKAEKADRRWFLSAAVLVVLGFVILLLAWGVGLDGGRALGALYGSALVLLMGVGCLIAYAIAAIRERSRRRPFDGT
jgi:hypothetical protein